MTYFQLFLWVALFTSLGRLGAPIGRWLLPQARDGGAGIGRVLFLVLWMYLFWIVPLLTPIPSTLAWAVVSFGAVAVAVGALDRKMPEKRGPSTGLWIEGGLFLFILLICLWMRSWAGDIWQNEKFMDAMVLKSLMVAKNFPPQDSWFAGAPINYHHLGHLLFLPAIKIVGTPIEFSYNLALCAVLPLAAGALFSFSTSRVTGWQFPALLSLALVFMGTYATLDQLVTSMVSGLQFSWWNTSRVIDFTIHEYPIFSFQVGDLHAHFISISVTLAYAMAVLSWRRGQGGHGVALAALIGGLLGLHYGMNAWALPALLLLLGVHLILSWPLKVTTREFLAFGLAVAGTAIPFAFHYTPPPTGIGWVEHSMRSPMTQFLQHWFGLLAPILLFLIPQVGWMPSNLRMVYALVFGSAVLILGPTLGLLTFLLALVLKYRKGDAAFLSVLLLLITCELVHVQEFYAFTEPYPRMNTVFKFYYLAWIVAFLALPELWQRFSVRKRGIWIGLWLIPALFLPMLLYTRTTTSIETLDGLAWLKIEQPEDWAAIRWLEEMTPPGTVIVEYPAPSLHGYSPISTFSGRPTPIAWYRHEGIWRSGRREEMVQRLKDISELYSTDDSTRFVELASKYTVKFVVLGKRERKLIKGEKLGVVQKQKVAAQFGDLTLFAVE